MESAPVVFVMLMFVSYQLDEKLNDGKNSDSGIDIYMVILFVFVIGTHPDGTVGNQRTGVLTGEKDGNGMPFPCTLENRKIAAGVTMCGNDEKYRSRRDLIDQAV